MFIGFRQIKVDAVMVLISPATFFENSRGLPSIPLSLGSARNRIS
jgi:hypothetical protein